LPPTPVNRARGTSTGPLFSTRTGARLSRMQFFKALQRVAAQANAHLNAKIRRIRK
jgi:hypothetical protein